MESIEIVLEENYIKELQAEFHSIIFQRVEKSNGLFITNTININISNDLRIFKETQIKRTLRNCPCLLVPKTISEKLSYFSLREDMDADKIYRFDRMQNLEPGELYAVQNIGHASQLIQLPNFNIVTDPVFGSPSTVLYPAQTRSYPDIENFIQIDVIIISHNHRDHLDVSSLRKILYHHSRKQWPIPLIFAPLGDEGILKKIGFHEVKTVDWYTKLSVIKITEDIKKSVEFISIPADHRSGRYGYDHHKSLVNGWIIHSESDKVIFKFSGDTRSLSSENQRATEAVLWHEMKSNTGIELQRMEIPTIICFEPSGPNYTRSDMNVTHQSSSYSALLKFVAALNLSKLSGIDHLIFLQNIKTFMIHHNKFELGPDRFNEGLFVFKKLLLYLDADTDLDEELEKQKMKLKQKLDIVKLRESLSWTLQPLLHSLANQSSLLVHAKDFIIEEIQRTMELGFDRSLMKQVLINNTLFLKVGQRINDKQLEKARINVDEIQKYKKVSRKLNQ